MKNKHHRSGNSEPSTRREFFRLCGRAFALGIGAIGAGRLIGRRQVVATGQTCVHQGICAGCGQALVCGLPPALSRRQALEGGKRT